jgi:hypothetical protein
MDADGDARGGCRVSRCVGIAGEVRGLTRCARLSGASGAARDGATARREAEIGRQIG